MIESSYSLYKLIILYMIDKVSIPLSNGQISEFILEHEYTSYFHLQVVLTEMVESGLLETEVQKNATSTTYYHMTERGMQTLAFFSREIPEEIKADIDAFFKKHAYELRNEQAVRSSYDRLTSGDYEVRLEIREKNKAVFQVTMQVPSEAAARKMCDRFSTNNQEVYASIIQILS